MMDTLFEKNCGALSPGNTSLCATLRATADDGTLGIVETRGGDMVPELTLGGRRITIHSRFDPRREAERFINEAGAEKFDLVIVFGFGFAYHIEELLKIAGSESTVLVIEKNPLMLRKAFEYRDLTAVVSDQRLVLLVNPGEERIAEALRGKSSYRVSFLTHRGSHQADPEYYANIRQIAKSYLSTKEVNIATLAKFEKTWGANIARNIREFIAAPGAQIFYNAFSGVPAIVAAAGPSLTSSLEHIRKAADRALIVAVDTSYRILRRHGIEPHFCVCVDPQAVNARYFEGDTPCRTVMIADPTVHPSVFHLFRGRKAVTGMAFPMMKWIEDAAGAKGELAYGGSVSTNAYDFARRLGASPVLLAGQDLAFTGGLAHARGSYLDEQVFLRNTRFATPLMVNRFQLTALPAIMVTGIRTPLVRTNQKMMIFNSWFQKQDNPSLINATHDGAFINGLPHMPLEDIAFTGGARDLFAMIDAAYAAGRPDERHAAVTAAHLAGRCADMLGELDSLVSTLERAVALSDELVAITGSGSAAGGKLDYILKKLADTDRMIESKTTVKDMVGFTIQRVLHTITEGYEIDDSGATASREEQIAKRSHYLYTGLLEGCAHNRKLLQKMAALLGECA